MKRTLFITLSAAALLAVAGVASAQDAAKVEKGKTLFTEQKCALCHSIDGKGNAKGPLDGIGSKLTAAEIRSWITEPAAMAAKAKADRKPAMLTKYASLPKDDIDALVAYLSSLKKK